MDIKSKSDDAKVSAQEKQFNLQSSQEHWHKERDALYYDLALTMLDVRAQFSETDNLDWIIDNHYKNVKLKIGYKSYKMEPAIITQFSSDKNVKYTMNYHSPGQYGLESIYSDYKFYSLDELVDYVIRDLAQYDAFQKSLKSLKQ